MDTVRPFTTRAQRVGLVMAKAAETAKQLAALARDPQAREELTQIANNIKTRAEALACA